MSAGCHEGPTVLAHMVATAPIGWLPQPHLWVQRGVSRLQASASPVACFTLLGQVRGNRSIGLSRCDSHLSLGAAAVTQTPTRSTLSVHRLCSTQATAPAE